MYLFFLPFPSAAVVLFPPAGPTVCVMGGSNIGCMAPPRWHIDNSLGPPLPLLQITGPSGCGKTQFCMTMAVQATLPVCSGGFDGAVIYIDTEDAFSAHR